MSNLGFSYAQAARGLAPSSNVSSNPTSSASSEHGVSKDASQSMSNTSHSKHVQNAEKSDKESLPQPDLSTNTRHGQDDTASTDRVASSTAETGIETGKTGPSQDSSVDEHIESPKKAEVEEHIVEHTEEIRENGPQNAAEANSEKEKAKEVDDDWEKVSIPSVAAEKELKAAPIPTVNIWQQRKEAAQAKSKDVVAPRATASSAPLSKIRSQPSEESRKKAPAREETSVRGSGRTNSNGRPSKESNNTDPPRSTSQHNEKSSSQLPPVDAESWPTPESAIPEPGRRLSSFDKSERTESSEAAASSRKNKWQALPFIPSVKFETQIPGRRGGRNSTNRGRGGANVQSDRTPEKSDAGNMAPPPLPKTTSEQDRGRKGNVSRSNRASSVPVENGLEESDHSGTRKTTLTSSKDLGAAVTSKPIAEAETPPRQEVSRSSSQHTSAPKDGKPVRQSNDIDASQVAEGINNVSALPQQRDRATPSNNDLPRVSEAAEKSHNRDWAKDRSGAAQKNDSWRSERRSERSERGRGTTYRGRGNHSGYNTNPSFTAPLPQNGFDSIKQSQPEPRSRQSSQQYGTAPSFNPSRNNPRSQSIPISMMSGTFYQPPSTFTQTLPPIQTDVSFGGFGQVPNTMPSGIMSAMPYNEPLNGYAVFSMAITQLEYYFSVDNLCKDMFLRKHMDSQGFVPLRVIADFKRIKQMLGDDSTSYDRLRGIAQQARNIEYVIGEDGADRLRNREDWEKFVLPMEDRLPQAQNEGPEIRSSHFRPSAGNVPDFQMMNGGLRSAPPYINGFDESRMGYPPSLHFQQTPVADPFPVEPWISQASNQDHGRPSPTTSPLSKIQSPSQGPRSVVGSMTNGHGTSLPGNADKESTFPDEAVMALKVVVKDPDYDGDEDESGSSDEILPPRASGLRGGAGSPEQFERIQGLRLHNLTTTTSKTSEQTMYFSQEGPPPHLMRSGYIHEDYLTLREKAASQRADDHFDGVTGVLYPLWAEFLPRPNQFNVGMYEDFKNWALEDSERGNDSGKKYLVNFYDAMLCAKTPMTERVAADIVAVSRTEGGSDRPTWMKLRAAWRNGATNLKTRKRLTELLTGEEKAELDRGT